MREDWPQTVRELVEYFAETEGESRESLRAMQQVQAMHYTQQISGVIVFGVQGPSPPDGNPYAVCVARPALKLGDRYFRLEEVDIN